MEEEKLLAIVVPEGYEICRERSSFDKIVFKKKEIKSYKGVAKELFDGKAIYFPGCGGEVMKRNGMTQAWLCDSNNAPTKEQWKWLLALNKLKNTAVVLNNGWEPDWNDNSCKSTFYYNHSTKEIGIIKAMKSQQSSVYFKNGKLALKAIELLGEETIKTALGCYLVG